MEAYSLADEVQIMVYPTTQHYNSSSMIPLAFFLGNLLVIFKVPASKMLISFYLIWFTMVSMDFSKIWMVLYFLYNFVSDLYVLRLTWCSLKLGSDYQYLNISLLLHGRSINFQNDEWTSIFWMHECMHDMTYPKAWLDLHDSQLSSHLNLSIWADTWNFSWLSQQKKHHIFWSMHLFHHPPAKPKKKYSCLVSASHSVLSKSLKTLLLFSCW